MVFATYTNLKTTPTDFLKEEVSSLKFSRAVGK